jgi:hypothetical protein
MFITTLSKLAIFSASLVLAKEKISLQWAICEPNPGDALPKLGVPSTTPPYKKNPITYYDEQPPVHIGTGIMFRTKTNKGQPLSVIKVRFDEETSDVPDFVECGWGSYGQNSPTYTCEKRCPLDSPPGEIWRKKQIRFAERYKDITWSAFHPYGPYLNPKWKIRIGGRKAKFDNVLAEGMNLMELEVKVPLTEADEAVESITKYLEEQGVALCEPQEGKTMRLFRSMGYIDDEGGEL